jgi:hypothetical protein
MVAMPTFDLIAGLVWLSILAVWFIGVALVAWLRYRDAARFARHAARLAAATGGAPTGSGQVIPFRSRDIEEPGQAALPQPSPQASAQPAFPSGG